jgi:phospholipid/cholesterol/gamma-HCH transport system ATP-binding protein
MNSVLEIGQKIIYLNKGKKWWEGDKNSILETDNAEVNDFVYASELFKRIRRASQL